MITRITGVLNHVFDDRVRVQVGPIEYELLVSDSVRQQLSQRLGQEVTLHTQHYLEAGAMQSRITPRLLGFLTEAELEFFDLFCTVDKVGTKKALKAFARPIREIADAIQQQDVRYLSDLPGIGTATAEKIIATLRKKVIKFALSRFPEAMPDSGFLASPEDQIVQDAYQALLSVGHNPAEARHRLDQVTAAGKRFGSVEELLMAIYSHGR
jgi:Holliday junction DNA helicase RuvA